MYATHSYHHAAPVIMPAKAEGEPGVRDFAGSERKAAPPRFREGVLVFDHDLRQRAVPRREDELGDRSALDGFEPLHRDPFAAASRSLSTSLGRV